MIRRQIRFQNKRGLALAGTIYLPMAAPPYGAIVFSHGFDSGKDSPRNMPIAQRLVDGSLAVFLIDFTGHGQSEGTREESTIQQQTDDLHAAVDFLCLQPEINKRRIGINGSSSGALSAVRVAVEDDRVRSMVLRAPRTDGLEKLARSLAIPTLIVQGTEDPLLEQTRGFYNLLACEREFETIDGGTHLFEDPDQFQRVVELTTDWFERTLGEHGLEREAA